MKYHIVQLGCQMNISDGERVQDILDKMGFEPTDKEEEANLLGVIACSVRQKAIDKVYSRIQKWNKWKNKKNLITFVTGCVLPADREKFLKQFDMVFAMSELPELPEMIQQYGIVTPAGLQGLDKGLQEMELPVKESRNEAVFRLEKAILPQNKKGCRKTKKVFYIPKRELKSSGTSHPNTVLVMRLTSQFKMDATNSVPIVLSHIPVAGKFPDLLPKL